jgi:hypothetical protein
MEYGLYATKRGDRPCSLAVWVSLPPDAAVQQQPQLAVGEVAEAMSDPLDLLDQQVHGCDPE